MFVVPKFANPAAGKINDPLNEPPAVSEPPANNGEVPGVRLQIIAPPK